MNLPMSCILLEDEPMALDMLHSCVTAFKELNIVGQAGELDEAFLLCRQYRPQVAFMDIKLIGGDTFQLLQRLKRTDLPIPAIVLVSGFPEKAVTAINDFRQHIVHFIEKPFLDNWESKFRKAIDDLVSHYNHWAAPEKFYAIIKTGDYIIKVPAEEAVWAEVLPGGKSCLVTDDQIFDLNVTLSKLMLRHPEIPLQQCSREYAINLDRVLRILVPTREIVVRFRDGEKTFSIGKAYFAELLSKL